MSFSRQPLDFILAATGNVRVPRALLAHGGALSVSRLARETRLTPNGVRGVLSELERSGVVEVLGSGHTRLFRGLPGNPLMAALGALFAGERDRFESILAAVVDATNDKTILAVWLFGSTARHEDTIDSDLDIAMVVDAEPSRCDALADNVRERLRDHEHMGFTMSLVAMPLSRLRLLSRQCAPLWSDLVRDAHVLKGTPPERLVRDAEPVLARSVGAGA